MRKEELAGKLNERKFRDKLKREGGRGERRERDARCEGMKEKKENRKKKKKADLPRLLIIQTIKIFFRYFL